MKTHLTTCSFRFSDIVFVYNVIQTICFFFLEKVADLYEQSSRCTLLAVGAYWNTCSYISTAVLPKQQAMIEEKKNLCAYYLEMGVKWLSIETIYTLTNSFLSGIPCNSERDWRLHIDVLHLLPRLPCRSIHTLFVDFVLLSLFHYEKITKAISSFFMRERIAVEPENYEDWLGNKESEGEEVSSIRQPPELQEPTASRSTSIKTVLYWW